MRSVSVRKASKPNTKQHAGRHTWLPVTRRKGLLAAPKLSPAGIALKWVILEPERALCSGEKAGWTRTVFRALPEAGSQSQEWRQAGKSAYLSKT